MAGYSSTTQASRVELLALPLPLSALMLIDDIIVCCFFFTQHYYLGSGVIMQLRIEVHFLTSSRTLTQAYEQLARGLWAIHFTFLLSNMKVIVIL